MLQVEGKQVGEQARNELKKQFSELFSGPSMWAKALVLDQGLVWNTVTATPEDMESLSGEPALQHRGSGAARSGPSATDHR